MDIFIYSCSAQLISFEIVSTSKEINCAEHGYINMPPSLIAMATPLLEGSEAKIKKQLEGVLNSHGPTS